MKINRHKGNLQAQRKRRNDRIKNHPSRPLKKHVELIDGNLSRYPVAYCEHYGAFLTVGLMDTHRCEGRKCNQLVLMKHHGKDTD